jgi:hypothetical protein
MGAPAAGQGAGQPGSGHPGVDLLQTPQFQQYHQQLVSEIGQALTRVQQETIQAVEQKIATGQRAVPPEALSPNMNQHLAEKLISDPTRFFGEYTQALRSEWSKEMEAKLGQVQQQAQASQAWGQFWNEVHAHNQDIQAHMPLVQALFPQAYAQSPQDPSGAVNTVIGYVRGTLAQERATALEQEKRKHAQQQAISTGPGIQALLGAFNPQAAVEDEPSTPSDYVEELRQDQERRMQRNWGRPKAA